MNVPLSHVLAVASLLYRRLAALPEVRERDYVAYLDDDAFVPPDWLGRFGAAVASALASTSYLRIATMPSYWGMSPSTTGAILRQLGQVVV